MILTELCRPQACASATTQKGSASDTQKPQAHPVDDTLRLPRMLDQRNQIENTPSSLVKAVHGRLLAKSIS
jgi:hypothetical protein